MSYRKLLLTATVFDNERAARGAGPSLIRASVAAATPMWAYFHPRSRYRPKFASLRARNVYIVYDRRNRVLSSIVMEAARSLR